MKLLYLLFIVVVLSACERGTSKEISFYYWKTNFQLGQVEKDALINNHVKTLHVRYCDIDFKPGDAEPRPVSPVSFEDNLNSYKVVPVVFIKNRTLERLDTAAVRALAENVFNFVAKINRLQNLQPAEIQFDCDWTERTKDNYFLFIHHYRKISKQIISATIRLDQVKYPARTGVPPVDHGVLMYYNMGSINAGEQRSIYESAVADRYNSFIRSYPLPLDIALPVFSWGLKIRNGQVVELLNKIYFTHFQNDSNFRAVKKNWYAAKHACFKAGYYFAKNDIVKIENVSRQDLLDMSEQITRNSNKKIRNLLFYDLDSANLVQYEKDIFKTVLDRIH